MSQPHKHAEAIKAWADGAQVQVRVGIYGSWVDLNKGVLTLNQNWEYRIKPTNKVLYAPIYRSKGGDFRVGFASTSIAGARLSVPHGNTIIDVIEIELHAETGTLVNCTPQNPFK